MPLLFLDTLKYAKTGASRPVPFLAKLERFRARSRIWNRWYVWIAFANDFARDEHLPRHILDVQLLRLVHLHELHFTLQCWWRDGISLRVYTAIVQIHRERTFLVFVSSSFLHAGRSLPQNISLGCLLRLTVVEGAERIVGEVFGDGDSASQPYHLKPILRVLCGSICLSWSDATHWQIVEFVPDHKVTRGVRCISYWISYKLLYFLSW